MRVRTRAASIIAEYLVDSIFFQKMGSLVLLGIGHKNPKERQHNVLKGDWEARKETRGVHACGGRKDKDLNSEETASKINCPQNPLFHLEVNIYEEKTARHTEIS